MRRVDVDVCIVGVGLHFAVLSSVVELGPKR